MKNFLFCCLLLAAFTNVAQKSQFTLVPGQQSGIHFVNQIEDSADQNILIYSNFYGGAGVGVADFNADGLIDVYFASNLGSDKLYLNKGNFTFEDITEEAGIIHDNTWSTGVTIADVNADGLPDIYVTKELYDRQPDRRRNKLYINQGNAVFKEMAKEYEIDDPARTRHATFFDYDKDGYLDLFVLNQPPNPGSYSEFSGTELLQAKYTSRLYKNIEGKRFNDVTVLAELVKAGFPNGVVASDLNNDGWTDLYVANDFNAPDFIYINDQDGTFTNIANEALNHMSFYSMGVDVADINNDGNMDVFVVDMTAEDNFRLKSNMSGMNPKNFWKVYNEGGHYQYMFNNFHLSNGNNTYSDIAQYLNMAATDWSWANLIADYDNDGHKDIYITNGLLRDIRNTDGSKAVGDFVVETANEWVKNNPNGGEVTIWDILDLNEALSILPSVPISNFMYQNKGDLQFDKVADTWGIDQKSFSNGAAYADFDNDGDLDIVVNNINSEAFLYRNNATANYLRLDLKSKEHKSTFGAKIIVEFGDEKQVYETTNVRGIYSTPESIVHFGLGKTSKVDHLTINWPNGTVTKEKNVKANQLLSFFMEDGKELDNKKEESKQLFTDIGQRKNIDFRHKENDFDDYEYQVLLPHKLSQFGPALAVGDVNKDGLEDVFVGAAVGELPALFIQQTNGQFLKSSDPFGMDRGNEDLDALFFDIDNDKDLDLYIVSGGNEFEKGHKAYTDRLYINDGKGNFSRSDKNHELPVISGSSVVSGDFDADGDLDLFVGGRFLPRDYPALADSKLLENDGGRLVDVTRKKAKGLKEIGLVTDANWSDYDNDGDLDLFVVGEWMGITVFENKDNQFERVAVKGLENTEGWWFAIESGDFDQDGDMDFVVGNLGLNYKYKTSPEEQFDVFYKDFDGNGSKDIVLGYYNFGEHFPVRGFSCSSQQVPQLKKDIKKYDIFASMDMNSIYGEENLDKADHFITNTFASHLLINEGGKFIMKELPKEAQFSNINDFLIEDINADGHLDIVAIGNLFVSEIETSRNDAGTGTVLLGNGKNEFRVIPLSDSGFFANKDAKKIRQINVAGEKWILVANNDDELQVYRLNDQWSSN